MLCLLKNSHIKELEEILHIDKSSFNKAWTEKVYVNLLNNDNYKVYCLKIKEKIAAFVIVLDSFDIYEIIRIAVAPKFRKKGYGSYILSEILKKSKSSFILEVREKNMDAINLYRKYQFKEISIRKSYYSDTGENAIVMLRKV